MLRLRLLLLVLILAVFGIACDAEQIDPSLTGAARGEQLVKISVLEGQPGCMTCHHVESDDPLVGPPLSSVAATARTQTTGLSAEDYLRQSIVDPDAVVAEGLPEGAMPKYGEHLDETTIDDIVAYLLTFE
jgi:mono/diheme cytochrome c family protein